MKYQNILYHGIINVGDLPIPFNIVLNAAVLTIVLTFVFLKVSWKESILTSKEVLFTTKQSISGKLFGLFILSLLTVPGLINNEPATVSITPWFCGCFCGLECQLLAYFLETCMQNLILLQFQLIEKVILKMSTLLLSCLFV